MTIASGWGWNEKARLKVLSAITRGFLPPLDALAQVARREGDDALAELYAAKVEQLPGAMEVASQRIREKLTPEVSRNVDLLLWLLSMRLGTLAACGTCALTPRWPYVLTFEEMPDGAKEAALRGWATSPIDLLRQAYKGLRLLCIWSVFAWTDGSGHNPLWRSIGYPGPQQYAPKKLHLQAAEVDQLLGKVVVDLAQVQGVCGSDPVAMARALRTRGLDAEHCTDADAAATDAVAARIASKGSGSTKPAWEGPGQQQQQGQRRRRVVVRADVVVVGSGAGGGVVASVMTQAGHKVVVVEKGPWVATADMQRQEGEALPQMFENSGLVTTEGLGLAVLAGSTLGGGTRINWCASFRTPEHVRREWAGPAHGLQAFETEEYDSCLDAVCERLGVHSEVRHNGQNQALADGLAALGVPSAAIPRNCPLVEGCQGLCTLGCASGHKRDTAATFLADAARTGRCAVMARAYADRLILSQDSDEDSNEKPGEDSNEDLNDGEGERPLRGGGVRLETGRGGQRGGRGGEGGGGGGGGDKSPWQGPGRPRQKVLGVLVRATAADGGGGSDVSSGGASGCCDFVELEVLAPRVMVCGGALHSPALLLRSGVECCGQVGAHLRLHPAANAIGLFPSEARGPLTQGGHAGPINLWEGGMMSAYSAAVADWAGGGYGGIVSVPQLTPAMFAALVPWEGGRQVKQLLGSFPRASLSLVYTRDRGEGGRVRVDSQGRPRLHYWPVREDREALLEGLILGVRALAAAGASSVMTMHHAQGFRADLTGDKASDSAAIDALAARIRSHGVRPNLLPLFSAHQMGSCRMGTDRRSSVCDGSGRCWDVRGLFLADASCLPTASGVNPMVTVEAIAHLVATRAAANPKP